MTMFLVFVQTKKKKSSARNQPFQHLSEMWASHSQVNIVVRSTVVPHVLCHKRTLQLRYVVACSCSVVFIVGHLTCRHRHKIATDVKQTTIYGFITSLVRLAYCYITYACTVRWLHRTRIWINLSHLETMCLIFFLFLQSRFRSL